VSQPPSGPLAGTVIVDLTRALSGPLGTHLLAGLGADVIKIEDPDGGDLARANAPYVGRDGVRLNKEDESDHSLSLLNRNRGKRSVTLNLKAAGAGTVFADLVRHADVVIENFSTGTAERLGVGYAAARAVNDAIVYCSISPYGSGEPDGQRAMDTIIQALSGVMLAGGAPDDPPMRVGFPLADAVVALYAVIGIEAALLRRRETGTGQHIDVSMLGALTSLVAIEDWQAMERLGQPLRTGPTLPRLAPFGLFACADGYVTIVAMQDRLAAAVFAVIGRPELAADPRFSTRDARVTNHVEVDALIEAWTKLHSVADVVDRMAERGVPVAPVRNPTESVADPRVVARGETLPVIHPEFGEIAGLRTIGVPIVFSGDDAPGLAAAPTLGQHNDEIYGGLLGYGSEHLAQLRRAGVI
jgi:crotonobetainyl-CoA:carnitine CoA-transferase CaiB-like acyl-CoA transferase